jgi:hypothetical protein
MEPENDMPTLAEKTLAVARRRARWVQYIKDGLSVAEIADIEGVREDNGATERRQIARAEGLEIWNRSSLGSAHARGVLDVPSLFRTHLKNELAELAKQHQPEDLQALIGLNPKAVRDAQKRPYAHNWTLGQMQRLAQARGKTFEQLMIEAAAYKELVWTPKSATKAKTTSS